jgi:hypothetical protein
MPSYAGRRHNLARPSATTRPTLARAIHLRCGAYFSVARQEAPQPETRFESPTG